MVDPKKLLGGFIRAIKDTAIGIVISILTDVILKQLTNNEYIAIIVSVIVFIIALISLYEQMDYWGILYLIGWILGILVMYSVVSPIEIVIDIVITFFYLYTKISKKLNLI